MAPAYDLRPSAAHRWVWCAGYLKLAKEHPEKPDDVRDTSVRDEGTVFHKVFYHEALGFGQIAEGTIINGIEVDEQMVTNAIEAADYVRSWDTKPFLEETLDCGIIHPYCGGTADAYGINMDTKTIYVFDPKYGYRPVNGVNNWQLGCYLGGIYQRHGMREGRFKLDDPDWKVVFTIYQPRLYGSDKFKSWHFTLQHYANNMLPTLQAAATRAQSGDRQLRAGEHCRNCEGAAHCEALRLETLHAIDTITGYEDRALDPYQIAFELDLINRAKKILDTRKEAVELELTYRLKEGEQIPAYTLKPQTGRIRWKPGSKEHVVMLAEAMGYGNIAKPPQPMAVRQAEKIVGADFIKAHAETPTTGLKLHRITEQELHSAFNKGQ